MDRARGGLNAVHIDAAREMHRISVSGRVPQKRAQNGQIATTGAQISVGDRLSGQTGVTEGSNAPLPTSSGVRCCAAAIDTEKTSTLPVQRTPSLEINPNWSLYTQRRPILNAEEIEHYEGVLDIPVPEMIFGNNCVGVTCKDTAGKTQFHVDFNALDALRLVERNPSDAIKVSYANDWYASRLQKHAQSDVTMEVYKPYDWTYSSEYRGTCNAQWTRDDEHAIPTDKLTSANPILFYDDMVLYEDELGDNGISVLSVKVRAMKDCLLVLQRLFVRVDEVLLRIYDTRLYVDFDTNEIIREFKVQQDDYKSVVARTRGAADPRKPLRDPQWCAQTLPVVRLERHTLRLDI